MLKFTINRFIDLRLENGKTNIYVNNNLFRHCKYILLNISIDQNEDINDIHSIDDAVEGLDQSLEFFIKKTLKIAPEMLFWAHCSNFQAWYENNYNTCLIHSNLAFPLLKELIKAGDLLAIKVFKEEVAKRLENKNLNLIRFLLYNGYLDYLNKEEVEIVLKQSRENLKEIIISQLTDLMKSMADNFLKIKEIIDLILFIDLKYNQNLIFSIFSELDQKFKMYFARVSILYINYKEFLDYKISYGSFFVYFEKILNYVYENYPEIKELLKIIDSGFIGGATPLDEKYSYGVIFNHRAIY